MLPPSRYPRQRLLITLTLASGIPPALVNGLIAMVADDSLWRGLVVGGAFMLPPAFLAWLLLGDPSRRALGLVLTYAGFFVLAGGALLGAFFWYGMAFVATPLGGAALPLVEVAVIVPYVVLGVATERTIRELYGSGKAVRESGTHLLAIGALYVTSLALASGLDFDFSRSERRSMRALSDALRHSVFRVQACAIGYALARADSGYPRSLAAMGPSGQNCLDKQLAAGRPEGLIVEYEPAAPDEAGRVPSFVVTVRARQPSASGESLGVTGDTSGLVGTISRRTDPTGEQLVDQVALLRTCALFLRAEHPEGRAASSIGELAARYGSFRRADLSAFICERQNLEYFAHFEARDSLGAPMGYRLSYAGIPDRSGRLTDFEIVARPLVYGETGIRSYYVRSDGPIHVTLGNRAATTSDAVVPVCEYGEKWSTLPRYRSTAGCARMPSVRPPAVALVHDTIARAGQSFTVAIRDAADPSRSADPTYEHVLWCRTVPGPFLTPRRSYEVFQRRSELECKVDLDARVALFVDPMRIVVYTRDRSGAIGRVESVVQVVAPGQ
jgi:hypothetical protein